MQSTQKFNLVSKTAILQGEQPRKPLEAIESKNPNQSNRVRAFLPDGTKVMVAQRPGKGGMDFNKLLSGKAYAVAADAFSPVFEKKDGKATNVQKTEEGLPLYSTSGFYLLSSKEYPALDLFEAFVRLEGDGEFVLAITDEELANVHTVTLDDELDADLFLEELKSALGNEYNAFARFDEHANRERKKKIAVAKVEADAGDEDYTGVEFKELAVSPKDGNPFLYGVWMGDDGKPQVFDVRRTVEVLDDDGRLITRSVDADEAAQFFVKGDAWRAIMARLEAGDTITVHYVRGHFYRSSVSFRRKIENVRSGTAKSTYGDGVFIRGALKNWTRAVCGMMHSMHPNFPAADYDSHYYVLACRQAEVGMNRKESGWHPPQPIAYDLRQAFVRVPA